MNKTFTTKDNIEINLHEISMIGDIIEQGNDIGFVIKPTGWYNYDIQLKNGNTITRRSKSWREYYFRTKPKNNDVQIKKDAYIEIRIDRDKLVEAWKNI